MGSFSNFNQILKLLMITILGFALVVATSFIIVGMLISAPVHSGQHFYSTLCLD